MTFQPNRPEKFDRLNDSQADIQSNFEAVNTDFGVNHFEFDDASGSKRGKHKNLTIVQTEDTGGDNGFQPPLSTETEVVVFSREVNDERVNAYMRYQDSGEVMPITPWASCILQRTTRPNILPGSLNIERITWGTAFATVTFKVPYENNEYMVFVQEADQTANITQNRSITVNNKRSDKFSFSMPFTTSNTLTVFIRVY